MDIDAVITHLRANVPVLAGRVAGAADFARSLESQVSLTLPAAYVIPLDEDAEPNPPGSGLRQNVTERIGVVVEFANDADRRGQVAATSRDAMRTALWAALLNWRIDPVRAAQGLFYAGGQLRDFDRARLFYQWDFALEITITQDDGWQEPTAPLAEIDLGLTTEAGGGAGPTIHIPLPQP